MVMEKKSFPSMLQLAKIAALLVLFLLAPFVPSSLRSPYLYLLFNALVVTLGVEAGFLGAISGPRDDKKPLSSSSTTAGAFQNLVRPSDNHAASANAHRLVQSNTRTTTAPVLPSSPNVKEANKLADASAKVDVAAATARKKIKKCPSRASIFFIGSVDAEAFEDAAIHEEEEEEEGKGAGEPMSKQELFTKAEAFIGNFYKQLKMQREESWKKLQDLYYHHQYKAKAF